MCVYHAYAKTNTSLSTNNVNNGIYFSKTGKPLDNNEDIQ